MAKKYYSVLGCKLNGSPRSWASTYQNRFFGVGHYPAGWDAAGVRRDDIQAAAGMTALSHLGFKLPVDIREFLERGCDVVVDYFTNNDWWQNDPVSRREIDKSVNRRSLNWYTAFSRGLLLLLLCKRWRQLEDVCGWVEPNLRPEFINDNFDEGIVVVYKLIASRFGKWQFPGLARLSSKLHKSGSDHSKSLMMLWNSVNQRDQGQFDLSLPESLVKFSKYYGNGPVAVDWVAWNESVIALCAEHFELKIPKLNERQSALLVTRRTVGLED